MQSFSLQRSSILALVVFVHGMLGLLLLSPPNPRSDVTPSRKYLLRGRHDLILVFLKTDAGAPRHRAQPARPPGPHHSARPRRRPPPRIRTSPRRPIAIAPGHRQAHPLVLNLPSATDDPASRDPATAPSYIPGGRAFQQRIENLRRRRQHRMLPDDRVPGMPHFAMRDPRMQGLAGALHVITHDVLGAADPACVRAATDVAMTKKQRARRHINMQRVRQTIFEHHCVLRPASWMAPQGPATHLTGSP